MGFIDKKGDLKISTKYKFNYQSNFENGIAKVNYSRKRYGNNYHVDQFYIDIHGTEYVFEE